MTWSQYCCLVVIFAAVQASAVDQGRASIHRIKRDTRQLLQRNQPRYPGDDASENASKYLYDNTLCEKGSDLQPGDILNGDLRYASANSSLVGDCVNTKLPGLWFVTEGTGEVLRAKVWHDNHTGVAIFKGNDCNSLSCVDSIVTKMAASNTNTSEAVSTYWDTTEGETYFIYVYGTGEFQLTAIQQTRPENDYVDDATALVFDTPEEGSTDFATPDQDVMQCGSEEKEHPLPGLWFQINGTGALLQAHVKRVKDQINSEVFIYTSSLQCVDDIEIIQYYDSLDLIRYPISNGYIWDSQKGETYYILVLGDPNVPSNFEITIYEDDLPMNDQCTEATFLELGRTFQALTKFANFNDVIACNANSQRLKSTASGVWYSTSGLEGAYRVTITSDYTSQLFVFNGASCAELVCVETAVHVSENKMIHDLSQTNYVTWNAAVDETYYILVQGSKAPIGVFDLKLTPDQTSVTDQTEEASIASTNSDISANSVATTANVSFGFFPNAPVRTPSDGDVNSLMEQTSKFFSQVFDGAYGDAFVRFEAEAFDREYEEEDALPVTISFTATVYFVTLESVPSTEEALSIMAGSDFQTYIRNYVWQAEPYGSNMFFQTLRVAFGHASLPNNDGSGIDDKATMERVDAKGRLSFGFFPYTDVREPSEAEVEALLDQTIAYFTDILGRVFDDFARFGALDTSVDFSEGENLPVRISLDLHVFFTRNINSGHNAEQIHTPENILQAMSEIDLTDYIQQYVWESKPFSENIFYETMQVIFSPDSGTLETIPTDAPQLASSPGMALLNVALYFSFHDTATTVMREPGAEEISGLLNQTTIFFSQFLNDELAGISRLSNFSMIPKSVDYKEENEFSVVVYAEVRVSFASNATIESHTTAEEILVLMETANMGEYVENYVWFSEPVGSIFFATNQAVLEPYTPDSFDSTNSGSELAEYTAGFVPTDQAEGTTEDTSVSTLVQVETDLTLVFNFFTGTDTNQQASQAELDSLTAQTEAFFTKVLGAKFDYFIRLDMNPITAGFVDDNSTASRIVSWKLEALFDGNDYNTEGVLTSRTVMNVLQASDIEDYVHNFVWSTAPIGSNLFFNTDAVQFENWDGNNGVASVAPTPAPTTRKISKLVIKAIMTYGFLPDQVIDREPTEKELQSVLLQTSLFFNKIFRDSFNESFRRCEVSLKNVELVENAELPVSISYEIEVYFIDASNVPSSNEVYQTMENANFEEYIELYIWNADTGTESMFYDTQQIVFQGTA